MPILARRLPALLVLAVAAGPAVARAQAPGAAAAEQVPATTVAFLQADDAKALRAAFQASQYGRLIADPAMDPLKNSIKEKLAKGAAEMQAKLGISLKELLELPQGPVSVAVIPDADGPRPVAVVVAADAGANAAKMADLMARVTKLAQEDKAEVKTESFAGATLTVITSTKEDEKKNPPLVWTSKGSVYHIATEVDALKDVLSHASGREDSLGSKAAFQAIAKKLGGKGQVGWFVDVEQVLATAGKALGQQGGNAEVLKTQLEQFGLDGLKAAGGRVGAGVDDFDQWSQTYLYAPGESRGLLKLFVMPQVDLKPQPWVPATASSYQSMSWDLDAAYKALSELADALLPGVLAGVEQQIAGPQGDGLQFERDLFGPLGDRITVVSDFKTPTGAAAADANPADNQRILFAVALEDAKAFQNTLNKIFALTNANPKKREFQGTTIYDFDLPEIPNADAAGLSGPVSLTIAKDQLFVATDSSLLEGVLRGGGASLADTPGFQAVAKRLPAKSSTLSYQRPEDQARSVYNMIKSGQLKQAFDQGVKAAGPDAPQGGDLIDPKLIPEFSVIEKYLTPGGGFGVMEPDGVTFTQFTLKKDQQP
jgi:hypothetical protein